MSEVTCKGSFQLGTACGLCSKCKQEIRKMKGAPKHTITVKSEDIEIQVNAVLGVVRSMNVEPHHAVAILQLAQKHLCENFGIHNVELNFKSADAGALN